jgi:hypothetical protein
VEQFIRNTAINHRVVDHEYDGSGTKERAFDALYAIACRRNMYCGKRLWKSQKHGEYSKPEKTVEDDDKLVHAVYGTNAEIEHRRCRSHECDEKGIDSVVHSPAVIYRQCYRDIVDIMCKKKLISPDSLRRTARANV